MGPGIASEDAQQQPRFMLTSATTDVYIPLCRGELGRAKFDAYTRYDRGAEKNDRCKKYIYGFFAQEKKSAG
ncbi:hypothetical protein Ciccas_005952 [Cichlidogyrus casuarinus]|uniref:Uncharacterized protein n=1 Tax=Cichlidogyrus casuarinus TaxID=1844966 RepID=A0ABD2Q7P4_9PLAT